MQIGMIAIAASMACFATARAQPTVRGDFNGDGSLDSARLLHDGIEVVMHGDTRLIPTTTKELHTADVDCDGRLDLVIGGQAQAILNPQITAEFSNAGAPDGASIGPFDPVWSSSAAFLENTTRHMVGDFDGDGRQELYTADYNGPTGADVATIRMFECTADNTWLELWSYSDGPRIWNGFAAADTDGDGQVELIAGKIGGSYLGGAFVGPRVYVFESDADNHLVLDHLIEVDPAVSSFTLLDDIAVGDLNGDGLPDIAAGMGDNETLFNNTWGTRVRAFSWNSSANQYDQIVNHTQTNFGIGYLTAIAIGDSDHDNFREVIFFERIIPNIYRLEWNGAAFAIKSNPSSIPAGVCTDVICTDVDADNAVELVAGGSSGANGHVYVFESTADDTYSNAYTDSAGIGNTVLYVALDETYDPPLIVGSAHSRDVLVAQFEVGLGMYQTRDFFSVAEGSQLHEITIGRLDFDCGLDLILTNFTGSFSSGIYQQRETAPHAGDVNCDGTVNIDDLLAVINAWGPCPPPTLACPADVDHNGIVNIDDLLGVITNWG